MKTFVKILKIAGIIIGSLFVILLFIVGKTTCTELKKDKDIDSQIEKLRIESKAFNMQLIDTIKAQNNKLSYESIFAILGSLGGYSCQISVREEAKKNNGSYGEKRNFVEVQTKTGKKFFFGNSINRPLAEGKYSILSLLIEASQKIGNKENPNITDIFRYVTETVGSDKFGIPRISENHKPNDLPINYVKLYWPKILPLLNQHCEKSSYWPIMIGLSIQANILSAKEIIDPKLGINIIMECAIPMSKIDPDEIQ